MYLYNSLLVLWQYNIIMLFTQMFCLMPASTGWALFSLMKGINAAEIQDNLKPFLMILHFEMVNVLVVSVPEPISRLVQSLSLACHNLAVDEILNNGKTRFAWLMSWARSIWLIQAEYNANVIYTHIAGVCNVDANILSQWSHYKLLTKCGGRSSSSVHIISQVSRPNGSIK